MTGPPTAPHSPANGRRDEAREQALLSALADLPTDDPRRDAVRSELITMHLPLVRHLAARYRERGEPWDDLMQVGTVGLIQAVDRFDPGRDVAFSSFATPTILGEIRRHFRDRTWAVHVPRRMQELQAQVTATVDELTRTQQRSPSVREIAEALDITTEDVLRALEARQAYASDPLDGTGEAVGESPGLLAATAVDDPAFAALIDREALRPLVARLPERERQIVHLRFAENRSQSEIAHQLGISQMHVSRLLARSLAELRDGLAA